jgi:hypothetical protein
MVLYGLTGYLEKNVPTVLCGPMELFITKMLPTVLYVAHGAK